MYVYADDATTPEYFTNFLTSMISNAVEVIENDDLSKLAVQTKYSEDDVTLLTMVDITILMKAQKLKHRVKNIAGLAGSYFGPKFLLHQKLKDVAEYV